MALTTLVSLTLLLCSLTAGFLVGFAVVAMPGLRALDDAPYLRAFQAMDRVIQDRAPLFMIMWVGSVVALVATLIVGVGALAGLDRALLIGAGLLYLGGVQVPTATVNIPLNNRVQSLDLARLDDGALHEARQGFEGRWNRWNAVRTALAVVSVTLLVALLARL